MLVGTPRPVNLSVFNALGPTLWTPGALRGAGNYRPGGDGQGPPLHDDWICAGSGGQSPKPSRWPTACQYQRIEIRAGKHRPADAWLGDRENGVRQRLRATTGTW